MGRSQADEVRRTRDALLRQRQVAGEWGSGLSPSRLAWRPAEGGWGAGQIFEHLVVAQESYLKRMEPLVDHPADAHASAEWSPSVLGNLLVRSLRSPRRLPAPKLYRVGDTPRSEAATAWVTTLDRTVALLERATTLPWNRLRFTSPVSPLIRLNFGDGFAVMVAHGDRHHAQIERVLRAQE